MISDSTKLNVIGESSHVLRADGGLREIRQRPGGGLELFHQAIGLDDLAMDRRAAAVTIKLEQGTLRGKSPDGRSGGGRRVPERGVPPARRDGVVRR
ncbi:MAG TPA: hypothetical protein VKP69_27845 [Isosphaeraceae bacterium]|nr:hypothetical protein [Isosphaeraceae bacterium]